MNRLLSRSNEYGYILEPENALERELFFDGFYIYVLLCIVALIRANLI